MYGGQPFAWRDHLARLERTCAGLRLPVDTAAVDAEALALLEQAGEEEALLRLVVTRGGRRIAHGRAAARAPADRAGDDGDLRADARAERAQDPLLRGQHARRAGSRARAASTRRCSSRRTGGCSRGRRGPSSGRRRAACARRRCRTGSSTRSPARRLLEELEVEEAPCTLDDVRAAEEAFIASSVREVMPIAVVDDIELPAAPGPLTARGPRGLHAARRARARRGADGGLTASRACAVPACQPTYHSRWRVAPTTPAPSRRGETIPSSFPARARRRLTCGS